jgi:hypothetical protein
VVDKVAENGQVEVIGDSVPLHGSADGSRSPGLPEFLIHLLESQKAKLSSGVAGLRCKSGFQRFAILGKHSVPTDKKGIGFGILPNQGAGIETAKLRRRCGAGELS